MKVKFEYQTFVDRTRLKQREIAGKVGVSTGLVGHWATGRGVPSYERLGGLIELGMTAQEMFGEELGSMLVSNSVPHGGRLRDEGSITKVVKAALLELSEDGKITINSAGSLK